MARKRAGTSSLARLVALLVCAGCVVLIALLARESYRPLLDRRLHDPRTHRDRA